MSLISVDSMIANTSNYKNFIIRSGTASSGSARIHWANGGVLPPNGVVNTSSIGGVVCTKDTLGALPFTNTANDNKIFNLSLLSEIQGYFLLVDRLWECSVSSTGSIFSITDTLPQIVNSITWPARDILGTSNGEGVYIAAISNGGWGAGTVDITMEYTNSLNQSGRIGQTIFSFSANPISGHIIYFSLQSGDTGVRSVQSITLTTTVTIGTFHLIAFKPISISLQTNSFSGISADFLSHPIPSLYNDSCLAFISQPAASAAQVQSISGYIQYSQG
jgi:hypothetical protein